MVPSAFTGSEIGYAIATTVVWLIFSVDFDCLTNLVKFCNIIQLLLGTNHKTQNKYPWKLRGYSYRSVGLWHCLQPSLFFPFRGGGIPLVTMGLGGEKYVW